MTRPKKGYFEPLAIKLAFWVIILVVGTLVPALYFAVRHHYQGSLEIKQREVYAQGKLIRMALEHQMIQKDRSLIKEMVERFSDDPSVKRVLVLDHRGQVMFTNDPSLLGHTFSRDSATCQVCHAKAPNERSNSALLELDQGTVLRGVHPLYNRKACHGCHPASRTVNGMLIMDTDVSDLKAALKKDTKIMAVAVGLIAMVLLAGMSLAVRWIVLRRLRHIELSTRAIAAGDFSRRVKTEGKDALSRLGNEFNTMTDSLVSSLNQLRQQRTQLENVMNSVDDGVLVVDETLTIVAANKALAKRWETPREELLRHRCCDVWGPESDCGPDRFAEDCPANKCFEDGQSHTAFKTRVDDQGNECQEEVFASPVFAENGKVEQVVEVWRDITQRKSHEARMAEFQRLASVGTLASGFSHEVNTPLGTVLLCVDEISRQMKSGCACTEEEVAEISGHVDLIRSEILRCRNITQQFLQLSKGQSLSQDLVEVPSLVRSTIPLVAHVAKEANVRLHVIENEESPVISANPGAVQQILLNLLLNAIHASDAGKEVQVSWRADPAVVIRVKDEGVGMTREVKKKVFEPFFSQNPNGTGLGLFVSLNLIRNWGGDIRVESEPGRGATFEVVFPMQDP